MTYPDRPRIHISSPAVSTYLIRFSHPFFGYVTGISRSTRLKWWSFSTKLLQWWPPHLAILLANQKPGSHLGCAVFSFTPYVNHGKCGSYKRELTWSGTLKMVFSTLVSHCKWLAFWFPSSVFLEVPLINSGVSIVWLSESVRLRMDVPWTVMISQDKCHHVKICLSSPPIIPGRHHCAPTAVSA